MLASSFLCDVTKLQRDTIDRGSTDSWAERRAIVHTIRWASYINSILCVIKKRYKKTYRRKLTSKSWHVAGRNIQLHCALRRRSVTRSRARGGRWNEDRYSPGVPLTVIIPPVTRRRRRGRCRSACRAPFTSFAIDVEDAAFSWILPSAPALLSRITHDACRSM